MSELYNRIERLCENNQINITTMCKNSGASRASLSDLKMGRKQSLSADTLSKIASYFGITVDYLIGKEIIEKSSPFNSTDERRNREFLQTNQLQSTLTKHGIINISKLTGIPETTLRKYLNGESVPEIDMQKILNAATSLNSNDVPQEFNQNLSVLAFGGGGKDLKHVGYELQRAKIMADEAETEKKLEIIDFIKKNSFNIEKLNTIDTIIRAICFDKK